MGPAELSSLKCHRGRVVYGRSLQNYRFGGSNPPGDSNYSTGQVVCQAFGE